MGIVLNEGQQRGLEIAVKRYKDNEKYTCIMGYAGCGKAQPIDTIIPTPTGKKKLKDLKVGDYIFDRLGKPTRVTGIFPQGQLDNYKITFSDNRVSYCNDEHIWTVFTSKGNFINKTVRQMLDEGIKREGPKGAYKFKIPINKAIEYERKDYDIDPYVIGCFLGDGCCLERYLTISSDDEEIPAEISKLIGAKYKRNSESNYSWTFEWNTPKNINGKYREYKQKYIQTEKFFEKYSNYLINYSYDKSIPEDYKFGSIQQRFDLIQGLMDTDGSITCNGNRFNMTFTSTSFTLVKDLQDILWSLGYKTSISEDIRTSKYTNNICYRLLINVDNIEKPKFFRLKRKKDIAEQSLAFAKKASYDKLIIQNIEKMPNQVEMVCIMVDNSEHLYLTNDYLVTHNTTLVKFIIQALGLTEEQVAYVSYTGKAAMVLSQMGNKNATTLHKLLYKAILTEEGRYILIPRTSLPERLKLCVVDEISMVPTKLIQLLASHNVHVICLGDSFQLPPVSGAENGILSKPHIVLTEIMRQAAESEIIKVTMDIRNGRPLERFEGKEVQIIDKSDVVSGMYSWADQILCARNETRRFINNFCREQRGFKGSPKHGEKIICLSNSWDDVAEDGTVLVNGLTGTLLSPQFSYNYKTKKRDIVGTFQPDFESLNASLGAANCFKDLRIDSNIFQGGTPSISLRQKAVLLKDKKAFMMVPREFDYGYAVTTHKAQGSEFDKVLVFEEDFPFKREEHLRWLYTACTRAKEKLIIVRK